jgi:hypothetical protein
MMHRGKQENLASLLFYSRISCQCLKKPNKIKRSAATSTISSKINILIFITPIYPEHKPIDYRDSSQYGTKKRMILKPKRAG